MSRGSGGAREPRRRLALDVVATRNRASSLAFGAAKLDFDVGASVAYLVDGGLDLLARGAEGIHGLAYFVVLCQIDARAIGHSALARIVSHLNLLVGSIDFGLQTVPSKADALREAAQKRPMDRYSTRRSCCSSYGGKSR